MTTSCVFLNLTSFTIFPIGGLNLFIGFTGLETGYDARLTLLMAQS
jgi:hypothetical protein